MSDAPEKIFHGLHELAGLLDVSDGRIVKGPGAYYRRADTVVGKAEAEKVVAALRRIDRDWDGEPEDMQEAREALAAYEEATKP